MIASLAAVALTMGACSGSKGDKGDPGDTGPQGPAGPAGDSTAPRPGQGLVYEIQGATLAEGAAPTVTFRVRDATGAPITLKTDDTTLAFTPTFTLAKVDANGKWLSLLTRTVSGRAYVQDGVTKQPVVAAPNTVVQAASQSAAAARIAAGADAGVYTYTFSAPITGVEAGATHRVGLYGNRVFEGVTYSDSQTFDFVPAGGTPAAREVVSDAACNRCHTVVNAHGGARRGVKLCLTCHTPQTIDPETGSSVDMMVMVHKIHKGRLLANGYTVVGFNQTPFDFSHVAMGPSHNTYFERTPATAAAIGDRGIIRECALCHQGANADAFKTSITPQNCTTCHDDVNPSDQPLNGLAPGTNHIIGGGPLPAPAAACQNCHGGASPVIGVEKAHSVNYEPTRNLEFTGQHKLAVTIDKVNNLVSGGTTPPDVEFTITLDGQPYDVLAPITPASATVTGTSLGGLAFQVAGPITDIGAVFPNNVPAPGPASALGSGADAGKADPAKVTSLGSPGKFRFTFPAAFPAGRTGTYVVSFESYFKESKLAADGATVSKPYAADPIFHDSAATPADDRNVRFVNVATGADVTTVGTTKTERRKIVDNAKCNTCHEDLGFHGNRSRQGVDYCATCHNPNLSNAVRARFQPSDTFQPAAGDPAFAGLPAGTSVFVAESVSTNVFIHKIHAGAELSRPYKLGTVRNPTNPAENVSTPERWAQLNPGEEALADFSRFELPSPIGNCTTCHDPNTYDLPDTPNLLPIRQAVLDCGATVTDSTGQQWCSGRTRNAAVPEMITPPLKAVCTSCHDTDAARAHADLNTLRPMTVDAVETCGACHGRGRDFDAVKMHPPVLTPHVDLPDAP